MSPRFAAPRAAPILATTLLVVACAGSGVGPTGEPAPYRGTLRVEPDPVPFEETVVGCVRTCVIELRNSGSRPLSIESLEGPDGSFRLRPPPPARIEVGGRRFVDLDFAPGEVGSFEGTLELHTDEPGQPGYRLGAIAVAAPPSQEPEPLPPLDLVLVLDVSTTMDELAALRVAVEDLFGASERSGLDVRVGLITFDNQVVLHRGGAFLPREELLRELDSQLVDGRPNPDLPRHQLNFDLPENVLDALYRSATRFAFRPGARRYLLLMTDDTFREPPEIFSDGTPATFSYREVSEQLRESRVRLYAVHDRRKARGLSTNLDGQPSLVSSTEGMAFELDDVRSGALRLSELLLELATRPHCR